MLFGLSSGGALVVIFVLVVLHGQVSGVAVPVVSVSGSFLSLHLYLLLSLVIYLPPSSSPCSSSSSLSHSWPSSPS